MKVLCERCGEADPVEYRACCGDGRYVPNPVWDRSKLPLMKRLLIEAFVSRGLNARQISEVADVSYRTPYRAVKMIQAEEVHAAPRT